MVRSAKKVSCPFYDEVPKTEQRLSDGPESSSKEIKTMGTKSSTLSEPSVIKNKTDSSLVLKKKISFANGRLVKTLTNPTGFIGHCLGQCLIPGMMQQKNKRSTTKGKQHLRTEFPPPPK